MKRSLKPLYLPLFLSFVGSAALAAVPAAQEPHHRLVLHTPVAEVFDVVVPPKAVMTKHEHPTDHLALVIGPARLRNEVEGAAPVENQTGDPGNVIFLPAGPPHHQVNIGETTGRWIDVELLPRPGAREPRPLGEAAPPFVRVLDNDVVRVDRLIVEPGGEAPASPYSQPHLFVVIRGAEIVEVPDSGRGGRRLEAGTVRWVEESASGSWRNAGTAGPLEALYVQVK